MADAPAAMPQNVRVRLNVGGTPFHTSLHTLMEGARRGAVVFQCLCVQILGPEAETPAAAGGGAGGEAGRAASPTHSEFRTRVPW